MNHDEIEGLEQELAARLGTPLDELRARRARCPSLELLRAAGGDALPDRTRIEIEHHLRDCALCRILAADLQNDELTTPTPAEAQRVRTLMESALRAEAQTGPSKRRTLSSLWALIPRPVLAAAALALLVWAGWMTFQEPVAPGPSPQPPLVQQSKPIPIPAALELQMPDVRLRPSLLLVTRGAGDSQQYLKDLAPALDAYRAGNYGEAAREFSALESKYPQAVEVFFYGGVSSLREGAGEAAVRSLERAQALAEPGFADEILWYLGLAHHRAGNREASRAQFERLCAGSSDFAVRACEAATAVGGASRRPASR